MEQKQAWIRVAETDLVKKEGIHPNVAGRMFSAAGFEGKKMFVKGLRGSFAFVPSQCKHLKWGDLVSTGEPQESLAQEEASYPPYKEIVDMLERINDLSQKVLEEVRQLRSHIPTQNISERARKALVNAKRTLDIYGG